MTSLLNYCQEISQTEREKGTYFENLIQNYLITEPYYKNIYKEVLTFSQWVEKYKKEGIRKTDTGIDLVAIGFDGLLTAIQCKNYAQDYRIAKSDIDSFFTASGKKDFSYRLIVATTDHWTQNAYDALSNQSPPVNLINRSDLENSVIDWAKYLTTHKPVLIDKKQLRPHQKEALKQVKKAFINENVERGKLIMACGTGKTFTSLKIAEQIAGCGKKVLFLVPSLALLSQTITEWTQQADIPLHSFAVCSDSDVGKQKNNDDDILKVQIHELQFPATTNANQLTKAINNYNATDAMTVIFSTYHSIDVIAQAQKLGLFTFDLVICDEAHRTTGHTFDNESDSNFVKIHDNDFIQANKRLYMTATPRIYEESAKNNNEVTVYSMDDEEYFGKTLHTISFSTAVNQGLLVDYKVLVLAVEEAEINRRLQGLLNAEGNEIQVDDAAKIIGCWKALSKYGVEQELSDDYQPMKRAVAFCQVIEKTYKGSKHKVSSKAISEMFGEVVKAYQAQEIADLKAKKPNSPIVLNPSLSLVCEAEHVDGSMNASEKSYKINWLKADSAENTCRILSNVRCLSEGVDVPALDAVLFLTARNSQIDVVQSVGRVMRLAEGKKRGYVILPVVIPANMEAHEALDKNENYKVVWQVLNALRSHDDRFDAMINKMEFDGSAKDKIEVIAQISQVNRKAKKSSKSGNKLGRGSQSIGNQDVEISTQGELDFTISEIERALTAKIVKKCGNRMHWEDWAKDVAKIAQTHIDRINAILEDKNNHEQIDAFNHFADDLRKNLNDAISDTDVVEMLAQHLITKPVFDALFENDEFSKHNPMSQALDKVITALKVTQMSATETRQLQEFYASVQYRVSGIKSPDGKQKIIKELYDKFFRTAFPKLAERMGIVYTPIEVVDFIIHSIEDVLQNEFNASLADKGVQIIDPFTGTGTFITRLMQSGIIEPKKLPQKYKEIHANEMLLLAYYISAINIESVYHSLIIDDYTPFNGICLTDTFAMYEQKDLIEQSLVENNARRQRQKHLDIKVIMGNPPYSVGKKSANDNIQNIKYPYLDNRIENTYAKYSKTTLKKALYNSYVRAIRWASDRIGDNGIIGFITSAGFIDSQSASGLRKCLLDEFSSLYIFHLRGNANTSGERRRQEGGNVFGDDNKNQKGSIKEPVAISILVKNTNKNGGIYFYDIGDYLSRKQKIEIINELKSISNITKQNKWVNIVPDIFNDWLNHRNTDFDNYISMSGSNNFNIFLDYSNGIATSRDKWVYNSSEKKLVNQVKSFISFYNNELDKYIHNQGIYNINLDPTKISWSDNTKKYIQRKIYSEFNLNFIKKALYRPFLYQYIYFDKFWIERSLNNCIYPNDKPNFIICLSLATKKDFSAIITNTIPDYHLIGDTKCYPLYIYNKNSDSSYTQTSAISDDALNHFKEQYPNDDISKEDIFYYIYGLLHSTDYREKYADNLSKQLPRIPRVKTFADFLAFSKAGRELADLHLNYESVPMYKDVKLTGGLSIVDDKIIGGSQTDFYVEKMKYPKKDKKDTIIYNTKFSIENIPMEAYDYIVNGKSAIEWVMERQSVKTDKDSGIVNDANDWAIETMNNPRYPMELLLRVITVSLETMKIVRSLPKLDI